MDSKEVSGGAGTTFVVITNAMHQFFSTDGGLEYQCLIMGVEDLKQIGLDFSGHQVSLCINDEDVSSLFSSVAKI